MAAADEALHLHVAGWIGCPWYRKARDVANSLATLFPAQYQVTIHEHPDREAYRAWLPPLREQLPTEAGRNHTASPFVCTGPDFAGNPAGCTYLGGCDATLDFARGLFSGAPAAAPAGPAMVDDGYTPNQYDYDLVVIGGGSGGLATSKEAAKLIQAANPDATNRVAVLDFVKPSTQGTTWGLGGTCVNVGCIPKKLMHQAALIGELAHADAAQFGWGSLNGSSGAAAQATGNGHDWAAMTEAVQNHIKASNFGFKVALRDAGVKYINGLGEFVGDHQIKVTEYKGKAKTPKETVITAARVLIATGGRPTPLTCPGGELAITSDDLFSLPASPGKTCVIGAGYVALECGGFLNALGCDVTVLVRSMLLRGFDRECCDKIGDSMTHHGVTFHMGVTPQSIVRGEDGKLTVTYSDGNSGVFDTVLCATGRTADTKNLNLELVGVQYNNPGNCKIPAVGEQTNVPWIYAIGDVLAGRPELTPVAIQAGLLLARRMFGGATTQMDYTNIATAVFTPMEYGSIGLSEEEAKDKLGEDNIEVYHQTFIPLEWALSTTPRGTDNEQLRGFAKAIVDKRDGQNERVVGLHYLGPNAGEVTQGYAVGFKKLTYQDLLDTVGIHPTTSEILCDLTVTKSSGASAAAGGC